MFTPCVRKLVEIKSHKLILFFSVTCYNGLSCIMDSSKHGPLYCLDTLVQDLTLNLVTQSITPICTLIWVPNLFKLY